MQVGVDPGVFATLTASTDPTGLQHFLDKTGASPMLLAHLPRSTASFGFIVETAKDTFIANHVTKALAHPDVVGAFPHATHLHALTAQVLSCYLRQHKISRQDPYQRFALPFGFGHRYTAIRMDKQHPEQMKAMSNAMRILRQIHG